DNSARVALAFNPDGSFASGNGSGPEGSFILSDNVDSAGTHKFSAQLEEATLPNGFSLDFHCGNDKEDLHATSAADLANQLKTVSGSPQAPAAVSHALRFATVAVDTDSAFMQNLFGNNTTNANIWIAKMINSMNLTYERDLLVRLYLGTTILRTVPATDPYAAGGSNPITYPADGTDLDNFGNYWAANEGSVSRAFAVLLSGLGPCSSGCSASGIAWINSYCQKPSSGGSYAVVEVFSQLSVDPNGVLAAGLYDHELGHNFGADHTHCTDITTGQWAVATNTIDTCYNGEAGSGCYGGATTSCPVGGVGTIMSYCHIKGCGSNLTAFHTTQINAPTWGLLARINAAPAACLNTTDDIFWDSFEKPGG
ncbi:MAG: M12 family metallo-peptidase, partial [Deltaproteobacteria bacterium]